ncbi:hypothetical protein [Bradyrhizobium sp. sGM-13]|uniref:hypothetical protein n=1 Tax=Bradyrhizobium sp. sGM-13 TaxID=2831781 RepID=UPI001BCA74FA|nr:hypothetical protein [Bradyrhizobium sp. sGM-13]
MNLADLISGNAYVGQNFPSDMPPAADGGGNPMDALDKLRELLSISEGKAKGLIDPDLNPAMDPPIGRFQEMPLAPPDMREASSGATDFSARSRQPLAVPLPQPRPAGAPLAPPEAITAFAPTDIQRAQRGMPPIPMTELPGQDRPASGLLSAIAPNLAPSQSTMNKVMASLGGGLSTVTGNTAGGAFARGMGGGLKAAAAQDKTDFDQHLKALKQVQDAKATGTSEEYKAALTNYYKVLTEQKNQQAAVATNPKAAKAYAMDKAPAEKPAAAPGTEISMKGDGTQASPYAPTSKADYDEIESGTYYIHPSTGQLRLKK